MADCLPLSHFDQPGYPPASRSRGTSHRERQKSAAGHCDARPQPPEQSIVGAPFVTSCANIFDRRPNISRVIRNYLYHVATRLYEAKNYLVYLNPGALKSH